MDLFEQLGMSIGGRSVADHIDSLRVTSDTRAIEALHEPDNSDPVEYVVTVEMIVSATSEHEARRYAHDILDTAEQELSDLIDTDITGAFEA
jgi:hypothetical protein